MKFVLIATVLMATVLGCLVCCSRAEEKEFICGPLQQFKIKRQLDNVFRDGKNHLEFIRSMFQKLFKVVPEARHLFPQYRLDNVFHPKFQAFGQRLLTNFLGIVHSTDDPMALAGLINLMIFEEKKSNVKPDMSKTTRGIVMETLEEYIGNHFDWDAWTACLNAFDRITLRVMENPVL